MKYLLVGSFWLFFGSLTQMMLFIYMIHQMTTHEKELRLLQKKAIKELGIKEEQVALETGRLAFRIY